ncbi:MAG TPA: hypothetical protein PKA95_01340 [Thermomicrobiales bacterium]|nr:hypothetical protein [Thermomicrobiales bacterium]
MTTERELLIGIADALSVLLRDSEPSKLARDWQHDRTPSRQLQILIARAKEEWGTECSAERQSARGSVSPAYAPAAGE